MEIDDHDREEIARLIKEGNTSGIIDQEEYEGEPSYRVAWELKVNKFKN
jgi:hypothetical protein